MTTAGAPALFSKHATKYGVGLAYNRAAIPDLPEAQLSATGIDGDATALAVSTRAFGDRWYASLLYTRLENMEVTNEGKYFNGQGLELYGQWEFRKNWWLIGGLNWLEPDDDADAGAYRVKYAVIGGRYSLRSFERMLYVEYRIDDGLLVDGTPGKDEITFGIRWDFGN